MDEKSNVYFVYYIEDFRNDYTAMVGIVVVWVIRLCKELFIFIYVIFDYKSDDRLVVVICQTHDEVLS